MIKLMAEKYGFNPDTAEGHFVPAGTFANLSCFFAARHLKYPHVKKDGYALTDKPVVFVSD